MVDGVVPAGQFGAVEAVVGRGAAVSGVPLAEQAAVVAVFAQRPGEGELVLGEVLQVADVAFVVGEELVPEGCLAGQQAGAGRGADGGGGVPAVEAGSRGGQFVERGGVGQRVAVGAERVGAVLVGHEEEDVLPGRPGLVAGLRTGLGAGLHTGLGAGLRTRLGAGLVRSRHLPAPVKRSPV